MSSYIWLRIPIPILDVRHSRSSGLQLACLRISKPATDLVLCFIPTDDLISPSDYFFI